MNVLLWVLQALLALHTAVGAIWKFSHSAEQTMATLKAIPNGAWLSMSGVELVCAVALLLPAVYKPGALAAPIAAAIIAAEMLLFTVLHFSAGSSNYSPMIYWLVVAAVCALIAYGRLALEPL